MYAHLQVRTQTITITITTHRINRRALRKDTTSPKTRCDPPKNKKLEVQNRSLTERENTNTRRCARACARACAHTLSTRALCAAGTHMRLCACTHALHVHAEHACFIHVVFLFLLLSWLGFDNSDIQSAWRSSWKIMAWKASKKGAGQASRPPGQVRLPGPMARAIIQSWICTHSTRRMACRSPQPRSLQWLVWPTTNDCQARRRDPSGTYAAHFPRVWQIPSFAQMPAYLGQSFCIRNMDQCNNRVFLH
jgi:hypothetical protein